MTKNTDKKNQHYIPKFYLRNFSYKGNNKQIGLFNLKRSFYHPTAKLKTQGARNFFYGKDGKVEDFLSKVEGKMSKVINSIVQTQLLPKKTDETYLELLHFVGLTNLRNPAIIDLFEKILPQALRERTQELDDKTDAYEHFPDMAHDMVVEVALTNVAHIIECIVDLDYRLLINQTKRPFIGSDFPVVRYNQFLEERRPKSDSNVGYGTIGLQIFIPLSPKLTLLLYDPLIYQVGKKNNSSYLQITKLGDIHQLNILQFLNCIEHVYFNEMGTKQYVENLHQRSSKYQKANKAVTELHHTVKRGDFYQVIKPDDRKKPNLLSAGTTDCKIKLNLSFVKQTKDASKVMLDGFVPLRPIPRKIMEDRK